MTRSGVVSEKGLSKGSFADNAFAENPSVAQPVPSNPTSKASTTSAAAPRAKPNAGVADGVAGEPARGAGFTAVREVMGGGVSRVEGRRSWKVGGWDGGGGEKSQAFARTGC
ncbi:hypothetical protein LBMAG56_26740 [Verrucomicrobiota bacterium]|nr:hypothetical protein LBMAG56_26740 [Verrucomicrobiota bacterium]